MKKDVLIIKNSTFEEVAADGYLTLLLFKLYAKLFNNGKAPKIGCNSCLNDYYISIVNNGLKKLEFMENKTNVLKEGLHFVRSEGMHFSNKNLTDEKAIQLLSKGTMKPSQFVTLPKGYTAPKSKAEKVSKDK